MALNLKLLPSSRAFVLAVSGGRDSVGLFHRLLESKESIGNFVVVHVNHQLRPESHEDAAFVEELCQQNKIPFALKILDRRPQNETEAREFRYAALLEVAKEKKITFVVTAHHQQDQLETRLMRLLRGTSPEGFLGIKEERELAAGIRLIRPALQCDPSWLHESAPLWCVDRSNEVPDNPRNFLRLEVIPKLQKAYPRNLIESFESFAKILEDDLEVLGSLVPTGKIFSREKFMSLPRALQSRWLRQWVPLDKIQVERGIEAVKKVKNLDLGKGARLRVNEVTVSVENKL